MDTRMEIMDGIAEEEWLRHALYCTGGSHYIVDEYDATECHCCRTDLCDDHTLTHERKGYCPDCYMAIVPVLACPVCGSLVEEYDYDPKRNRCLCLDCYDRAKEGGHYEAPAKTGTFG